MAVPSLEYRQYDLLPAQVGNHWTVVISHRRQVHCHPEIAKAEFYFDAVRQAQRIVDRICDGEADGEIALRAS